MFSTGTSWVLVGISDNQLYDMKNYLTIGRHMVPGLYSSFAYTPAGGAALKWYRDTMWLPAVKHRAIMTPSQSGRAGWHLGHRALSSAALRRCVVSHLERAEQRRAVGP